MSEICFPLECKNNSLVPKVISLKLDFEIAEYLE